MDQTPSIAQKLIPFPCKFTGSRLDVFLYKYRPTPYRTEYRVSDSNVRRSGFDAVEGSFAWTSSSKARLYCCLHQKNYRAVIGFGPNVPLGQLGIETKRLNVFVNNVWAHTVTFAKGQPQELAEFMVPAQLLVEGENVITLQTDLWSPSQYGSIDQRRMGVSIRGINFVPVDDQYIVELRGTAADLKVTSVMPAYILGQKIEFAAGKAHQGVTFSGWSQPEDWGTWGEGQQQQIAFDLVQPPQRDLVFKFNAHAYHAARTVMISVDGREIARANIGISDNPFAIVIPLEAVRDSQRISISLASLEPVFSPVDLKESNDSRKLSIGIEAFSLSEKQPVQ